MVSSLAGGASGRALLSAAADRHPVAARLAPIMASASMGRSVSNVVAVIRRSSSERAIVHGACHRPDWPLCANSERQSPRSRATRARYGLVSADTGRLSGGKRGPVVSSKRRREPQLRRRPFRAAYARSPASETTNPSLLPRSKVFRLRSRTRASPARAHRGAVFQAFWPGKRAGEPRASAPPVARAAPTADRAAYAGG